MDGRVPSNQLYDGPMYDPDMTGRMASFIGQLNPYHRNKLMAQHGRYLSGFGDSDPLAPGPDPSDQDNAFEMPSLRELEQEDDVFGSGIFDPAGRVTSNAEMGIFESHYSLPGFVAREIPFAISTNVSDVYDNVDVVYVPGGGATFAEVNGRLQYPAVLGPTPRPPKRQVGPADMSRLAVYRQIIPDGRGPTSNALAPVLRAPTYQPPRNHPQMVRQMRQSPPEMRVRQSPASASVMKVSTVDPLTPSLAIRPAALRGDDDPKPVTVNQMILAGAIVGVAVGIFAAVLKTKPGVRHAR